MRKSRVFLFSLFFLTFIALVFWIAFSKIYPIKSFSGTRAYRDIIVQVNYGPRIPGSFAHAETISYIQKELEAAGWEVEIQQTEWLGFSIQNILASRSGTLAPIIIGAHYDSRLLADQETGPARENPVPGANDGASGVAILLELARTLPKEGVPVQLVFFDAEDNGGLDGRQWIMGSRAFVNSLSTKPRAAIIVDMVGDSNLNIFKERNSNPDLTSSIWYQAGVLGFAKEFIPQIKYDMIDDHTSFLEAGIPAVDLIDFDYPYWHTSLDTADKVSAKSLQIVGQTILSWLSKQR
jgi:glutaminyl-peptide cyclotransferase